MKLVHDPTDDSYVEEREKSPLKYGNKQYKLGEKEARKGGVNSGKVRRQKKLLKDLIHEFGTLDVQNPKLRRTMEEMGIDPDQMTNDMGTVVAQYMSALKGNTQAFLALRDTKEEKPVDKVEQTTLEPPKPLSPRKSRKED